MNGNKIITKMECTTSPCTDDELIVHNEEKGVIAVLNKSAVFLWDMMTETENFNSLADRYYEIFQPKPQRTLFDEDFEKIIMYFEENGLVKIQ